jgi:hypothetical protein
MSIPADIDALIVTRCLSYRRKRARWMQDADFDDFTQTVSLVVRSASNRSDLADTPWEVRLQRAIWSTSKAMLRARIAQSRVVKEITSQAKAAQPVKTDMPVEQRELFAKVVAMAEANLTKTQILSIIDRDSLRKEMEPGAIRVMAHRAIKTLRDVATASGLLTLLVATGFLIGLFVGSRGSDLPVSSDLARIQSCRTSQRTETRATALARIQSCEASVQTQKNALTRAKIQSC